ncbi:MAG TPA: sigma 54-interacting transcriptional regulator [Syntrophomonas sp.]|nr:sigma 54-interacting transcriptional regulator [Syntrophomonas sp.]
MAGKSNRATDREKRSWEEEIKNYINDADSYRQLTENIPVLVYVYRNSRVIYVNPAVEKTLGFTFEEMTQKDFWDICHPDYRDLIRERGLARLQGKEVTSNYEFKIVKKNGEAIWVDVFFATTRMKGEILGIVGAYDITEKKLLKEQLQAARDELELRVRQRTEELSLKNNELTLLNRNLNNVVTNMSDGVVVVNRKGEIELLNQVFKQNWGDWLEKIRTKLQKDVRTGKSHFINDLFDKRISFQDEEVIYGTPGDQVHFLASGTPIVNEAGVVVSGLLILRPIKEIRQLVNRFSGAKATFRFEDIITGNGAMLDLIENAKMAAASTSNVLIEGESGTGKELFAQSIHNYSRRSKGPFIALNCGAIPRELIGSELFGYAEGAFTGARKGGNPGKFELASGGTIFLDEIGDMPFEQQAALLRVIQDKSIARIGGNQAIPVDVRIICATNKDLHTEMMHGRFRQDLYYRLNVISIRIPPLRERREDIRLLFHHFLRSNDAFRENDRDCLAPKIMGHLEAYDWPGNVRELQNVAESMLLAARGGRLSDMELPSGTLAAKLLHRETPVQKSMPAQEDGEGKSIWDARQAGRQQQEDRERARILELLQLYNGNISRIAREMGMSRTTLYKKMSKYKVDDQTV